MWYVVVGLGCFLLGFFLAALACAASKSNDELKRLRKRHDLREGNGQ